MSFRPSSIRLFPLHLQSKFTSNTTHAQAFYSPDGHGDEQTWQEVQPYSGHDRKRSRPVRLADVRKVSRPKTSPTRETRPMIDKEEAEQQRRSSNFRDSDFRPQASLSSWSSQPTSEELLALEDGDKAVRQKQKHFEGAFKLGVWWLDKRLLPAAQLKDKIMEKGYSWEAAEEAICKLKQKGLLLDSLYAEVTARHKWMYYKSSPSKIAGELKRDGVSQADSQTALEAVFGDNWQGLQPRSEITKEFENLGEDAQGYDYQLLEVLKRRKETMTGLSVATQKRRLTSWLQYRWHDWSVISAMMGELGL